MDILIEEVCVLFFGRVCFSICCIVRLLFVVGIKVVIDDNIEIDDDDWV